MIPDGSKACYLKKDQRITGPFPMFRINAMFREGRFKSGDMISYDKEHWVPIYELFPSLCPRGPVTAAADEKALILTPAEPIKSFPAEPPAESVPEKKKENFFKVLISDTGLAIALLWNFQEVFSRFRERSAHFYRISLGIHIFLSILIVLLTGPYYSSKFHLFFSPLMGMSLQVLLWGLASLFGWVIVRKYVPAGEKVPKEWMICAAGIFMNWGAAGGCFMALAHGIKAHTWVLLLYCFINALLMCSISMQLREYQEEKKRPWRGWVLLHLLVLTPLMLTVVYYFTKLI